MSPFFPIKVPPTSCDAHMQELQAAIALFFLNQTERENIYRFWGILLKTMYILHSSTKNAIAKI
jgi:hypothetical protein